MGSSSDKKGFLSRVTSLVNKVAFIDIAKGLGLTFRYTFSEVVTLQYPDVEKWVPYQRFRGRHTLNRDEDGRELCVACELCVQACPTNCITVVPMEDSSKRGIEDRVAKVWEVDLVRCMYCGYCEDACPTTAIRLGRHYETACTDMSCTVVGRDELLEEQVIPESYEGGIVVKSRFKRDKKDGISVPPDLTKKRKNFW